LLGGAGRVAAQTPEPSATRAAHDLAEASQLATEGRIDEAIAAYQALLESDGASERLTSRLALGRLYLDDASYGEAVLQFDAYLIEAPAGADVRPAQYLLAQALSATGQDEAALPLYTAYIDGGGGASAYARLDRALAMARLGEAGAGREGEAALAAAGDLPQDRRVQFVLAMAQALEATSHSDAVAWYERLRGESLAPANRALSAWRTAPLAETERVAAEIVQQYPETATAADIVENYPGLLQAVDPYYVGIVYYHSGDDAKAREIFGEQVQAQPPAPNRARASYYLAVLDERAGNYDAAIAGYGRALDLDPSIELADDALWWRGRLLEQAERFGEATLTYERLAADYGDSKFAPEARFRLALIDYKERQYATAAQGFASIAGETEAEDHQRALLWQGKALSAANRKDEAEAIWKELRDEAGSDYYGLRAAVLLDGGAGRLIDSLESAGEPDWAALREWLASVTSETSSSTLELLLLNEHWGLGQELLALGMNREATAELSLVLESVGRDPESLFQLARFYHALGLDSLSARAASRLLQALPDDDAAQAPDDLWRLAYPVPYAELVKATVDDEDVSGALLLAAVRQESFFDPLAGSPAGALGLAQIIPATGETIADDLDIDGFETGDLFLPATNLRFGAHYLAEQLDAFDGNPYYALAAYNGGPGNVERWRERAGDDVDLFLEEVEFAETREYVQLVLDNLAQYRHFYQGLDRPALPPE
jgi:soluble lytic murein transglycosylase